MPDQTKELRETERPPLRLAGLSGLGFVACYLGHLLLQGPGPADGSAPTVAGYSVEHRTPLLASEVLNGVGLIAFLLFTAALATSVRHTRDHLTAAVVLASGVLFVATGLVSTAAETALVQVAGAGEPAAVLVLFELQARVPVVFAATAFLAATSAAALRTSLLPRWLGRTGLGLFVLFLVGAVLSLVGPAEGESLPVGPAVFLVWMTVLCSGLLRRPT